MFNRLGQRVGRQLPGSTAVERYLYDAMGNQIIRTNFDGRILESRYDVLNRLREKAEITYPGPVKTVLTAFTYTPDGKRDVITTKPAGVSFASKIDYNYLSNEFLVKKEVKIKKLDGANDETFTLVYSRDRQGKLIGLSSSQVEYKWDELNRLKTVKDGAAGSTTSTLSYSYDDVGNLDSIAYPNGYDSQFQPLPPAKSIFSYDAMNRLTRLKTEIQSDPTPVLLAQFDYQTPERQLDPTGARRVAVEYVTANGNPADINRVVNYDYDELRRLTKEEVLVNAASLGTIVYDVAAGYSDTSGYDAVGNRRGREVSTAFEPYVADFSGTYNDRDQLLSGTYPETYDANGNTLSSPAIRPPGAAPGDYDIAEPDVYDIEGRLIRRRATIGGLLTTITLEYDSEGNRVRKVVQGDGLPAVITFYVVDDQNPSGYAQVLEEWRATGSANATIAQSYVYGHDLIRQRVELNNPAYDTYYFGYDGHGSTRFLMRSSGEVTHVYSYDAFGIRLGNQNASDPTQYFYAGEQWDPDLRLYYNRARYLNPNTGRFWTMDKYEGNSQDPLSLHKYLYAGNDPVNLWDPSGRLSIGSNWRYGRTVHREIWVHFNIVTPNAAAINVPISSLLGVKWVPGFSASIPDLVQLPTGTTPGQVYEIKPVGSYVSGAAQLAYYIGLLNGLDPTGSKWTWGSSYRPVNVIPLDWGVYAFVSPPIGGVILYEVEDLRITISLLVILAIEANKVQLEDRVLVQALIRL